MRLVVGCLQMESIFCLCVCSSVVQLVHQLDSSRPVTLVLNKASSQDVAVSLASDKF